ncbi:MAG: hypothetical protein ACLFQK_04930 [Fibrobacterota bacterium]
MIKSITYCSFFLLMAIHCATAAEKSGCFNYVEGGDNGRILEILRAGINSASDSSFFSGICEEVLSSGTSESIKERERNLLAAAAAAAHMPEFCKETALARIDIPDFRKYLGNMGPEILPRLYYIFDAYPEKRKYVFETLSFYAAARTKATKITDKLKKVLVSGLSDTAYENRIYACRAIEAFAPDDRRLYRSLLFLYRYDDYEDVNQPVRLLRFPVRRAAWKALRSIDKKSASDKTKGEEPS